MSDQSGAARKVFDCVLYDGEIDVLAIRMHELDAVVDWFVIVESTLTFSGLPRAINLDPGDPRIARFVPRLRHVIVADMPATENPWERELWQRNAVLRGVPDAAPDDLLLLSDVDEIPRAAVVRAMLDDRDHSVFGLRLAFFYFFVNYRNVEGPEAAIISAIAARRHALDVSSPNDLRYAVRELRAPARIIDDAGWHFSYLMDHARVRRKIANFSHQEYNTPEFLAKIDIDSLVRARGDLFERPGFVWSVVASDQLPQWLQVNSGALAHLFASGGPPPSRPARRPAPPVVICPYLLDHEANEIRAKFALDDAKGEGIPFFLWQDRERVGPEHAFEICWDRFPDRDIIIIHSDMTPFPGDVVTLWYDALCDYRSLRPDAGMIAANLFYPRAASDAPLHVQCAGGTFRGETIDYLHGEVDRDGGVPRDLLEMVRPVDWVTFGGVLIRREVIRACGRFDPRYQWAYYMDCDYSFEARLHGFRLLQVPVRLQHEESRSTRPLLNKGSEYQQHLERNKELFHQKWRPLAAALPSEEAIESSQVARKPSIGKVSALDTDIFAIQPGHYADRTSFLQIQRMVRALHPRYAYLEVGSDIGGSLLPHLLDPNCGSAVSIDPRPAMQADERGVDAQYPGNSTARMLDQLAQHLSPQELGKLSTIEADISAVDRSRLTIRPQLVLIDGEHTNVAAFSDFMAVLPLIADDALVTLHDANLVGDAIQNIERFLEHVGIQHRLIILPSCVAVFAFGAFIRPLQLQLVSHAEPTAAYFAASRQQRHQAVAEAVIRQTPGLPGYSIAELVVKLTDVEQRIAAIQDAKEAALVENTRLRLALDRLEATNAKQLVELEAFAASTSWKVTAPMRAIVNLLRRRPE